MKVGINDLSAMRFQGTGCLENKEP